MNSVRVIMTLLVTMLLSSTGLAQEQSQQSTSSDKTGTNPVNFQRDLRFYNEYSWLNVPSGFDGNQNVTTVEYRTPFANGKWQWRIRGRFSSFDVDQGGAGGLDLNYLRMGKDKQSWFFTDPQIVIDNENELEFALIDLEWGWMMSKWKKDLQGHSFYIRPMFAVGSDRPTDYSMEIGYKIIGFWATRRRALVPGDAMSEIDRFHSQNHDWLTLLT